ncbi:hypothetical protein FNV43_RR19912 [Rhamnella rubrinervis]|uniref:Uncharacterized protein n=1 Tax=Rhamnella rubrinervis TaxID=2594499 RepID=A0A8K0DZP0_9ROSA|nr:hypothetical protein FNV43_RR19912 [Rhamnella rubrinervis]
MSFGILRHLRHLRHFLNLAASNTKSIQLCRFLTAANDSKLIHSGNGKLNGGYQCTALWFSNPRDLVMVEDAMSRADAENLNRRLLIDIPKENEVTKTLK